MLTQNLTFIEDQGLWIHVTVLHCFCTKVVSLGDLHDIIDWIRYKVIEGDYMVKMVLIEISSRDEM